MKIKGIKYIAPCFDNSGYAQACRGNILSLNSLNVPITLSPVSFEELRPNLGKDERVLRSLVNKDIDYNIVIIHTTPEFWSRHKEMDKTNVGYTIWETSKLHPDWKDYINNNVEKVLVGCEWNIEVFKNSGVTLPIGVVPHGINVAEFNDIEPYNISGVSKDDYMFYSIFQWTERKHPIALIKAYWYAFQNNEKVALVLKVYRGNYEEEEKDAIRNTVKILKNQTPMDCHPKLCLILDMLSQNEMLGLHARGDCYVSLDRGEGFGLSPFAAGAASNPIIVTGFGGVTEYAKERNSYLVDYTLTPVSGMPWSSSIKSIVYTSEGYKCISELSENDLVFNKNCVLKKVQKVGFRKLLDDEVMYSLKYMSLYEPLEVTNKHKLYVVENGEKVVKRVSKIEEGDYLLVPKVKQMAAISSLDILDYVDRDNIINIDGKLKYNNNNSKLLIKRHIAVDFDFGRVCGFYLAEGCVYKNKSTTSFTFNIEECDTLVPECVQSLCNVFGIKSHSVKKRDLKNRNGIELTLNNPIVARFMLALFGSGSKTKCPKEFLLTSTNSDFRKCLLDSYWLGDGHVRKFRVVNDKKYFSRECVTTTASQNLVLWLRSLLLSLDVLPSITRNVRKDGRVSYVISVNNVIFDKIIGLPSNQRNPCGSDHHYYSYDNNNFAVRVNNIHLLEDFCGDVWSVSVDLDTDEIQEDGGSYILNGVASSNSPWYRGDQLWAEPDVCHGSQLMRKVYNNQKEAKQKSLILQKEIKENFSWEAIGKKIIKELGKL